MKKMTLLTMLLLGCISAFSQNLLGAEDDNYTPKVPEVEMSQKFIDVPVSPYTGTLGMDIPIYTIKSQSCTVSIHLRYHSGGIKVDQNATSVGLGWDLDCGGAVTRQIRGNPDEGVMVWGKNRLITTTYGKTDTTYYYASPKDEMAATYNTTGGWYRSPGCNAQGLYNGIKTHNATVISGGVTSSLGLIDYGLADMESDMFYFTAGSYSGKFIFNSAGQIMLIPYNKDVNIKLNYHSGTIMGSADSYGWRNSRSDNYFDSWVISTPDGKDYYFGANNLSKSIVGTGNYERIVGWALNKVVDKNTQDSIVFSYSGKVATYDLPTNQKIARTSDYSQCNGKGLPMETGKGVREITPLLKRIQSAMEQINFYTSGKVDSIKIISLISNQLVSDVQFNYGTFKSNRLKLLSLWVKSNRKTSYLPYNFSYFDTTFSGASFSRYSQDYWGYYNGAGTNVAARSLIPTASSCSSAYVVSRKPAWPQMQLDALTKITYPTGGSTTIEYEPHAVSTVRAMDNSIRTQDAYSDGYYNPLKFDTIGGLRVKQVKTIDPIKKDTLYKKYTYKELDSDLSSGHLYTPPSLVVAAKTDFYCPGYTNVSDPPLVQSSTNLYKNDEDNFYVGYHAVKVSEGKLGNVNGYTAYAYYDDTNTDSCFYLNICDNVQNLCSNSDWNVSPGWLPPWKPTNLIKGYEKERRVYSAAGQLLEKEKSVYTSKIYPGITRACRLYAVNYLGLCPIDPNLEWNPIISPSPPGANTYVITNPDPISSLFTPDDPLNANLHAPVEGGNNYFQSVTVPYASARRVMLIRPTNTLFFMNTYATGKMSIFLSKKIKEQYSNGLLATTDSVQFLYESPYHIEPTTTLSRTTKGELIKQSTVYAYDMAAGANNGIFATMKNAYYNPVVAAFKWKNNTINDASLRSFTENKPAAILPLSDYNLLKNAANTDASVGVTNPLVYPIAGLPYSNTGYDKTITRKYNAAGSVVQLEKKGMVQSMVWDYNNTQMVAEAATDSAAIAYASFEADGKGNFNYTGTVVADATAPMGNKVYSLTPVLPITKVVDSRLYVVSYWSKNGSYTVTGSTTVFTGKTNNGWTYYEHKVQNPAGNTISISGTGLIDEVRVYPQGVVMTSCAFEPSVGMAAQCDATNHISYYKYDDYNRLLDVRSAEGYVLKKNRYTGTLPLISYGNVAASGTFTRNNCPAGYTSGSSVYSVPANTYFSYINQATADQKATADVTANGQAYANAHASCTYVCSATTCSGTTVKCINGNCETGVKVYTASVMAYDAVAHVTYYNCTYHYEWSNGTWSTNYTEKSSTACYTAPN